MDELIKNASSDETLTNIFTAATPLMKQMHDQSVGMVRITPEVKGKKLFSVIIVCGEEEVGDVSKALDEVEKLW